MMICINSFRLRTLKFAICKRWSLRCKDEINLVRMKSYFYRKSALRFFEKSRQRLQLPANGPAHLRHVIDLYRHTESLEVVLRILKNNKKWLKSFERLQRNPKDQTLRYNLLSELARS